MACLHAESVVMAKVLMLQLVLQFDFWLVECRASPPGWTGETPIPPLTVRLIVQLVVLPAKYRVQNREMPDFVD